MMEDLRPYIVAGVMTKNEPIYIKYSLGSVYDYVDKILVVIDNITDEMRNVLKEIDPKNKIEILEITWKRDASYARNVYLDYIKENIYSNHPNLYYFRIDSDEIYYDYQVSNIKKIISENPEANGFRFNFYTFIRDHETLSSAQSEETRVCLFKYFPDIRYVGVIHEMPVRTLPPRMVPVYTYNLQNQDNDDKILGIKKLEGFWYCHFAWCNKERSYLKAVDFTKTYVNQGKETEERLNSITKDESSWWWKELPAGKKFEGDYPEIFEKLGYFEDQKRKNVKLSAFTIIKNAVKFDYPLIESIKSVLPIVDEYVINAGIPDEDGTIDLLKREFANEKKVKIFTSIWEGKEQGIKFFTSQTNKAKDACKNEWCLYVQADEVYHEGDYNKIKQLINKYDDNPEIAGFSFNFLHLYGNYHTISDGAYKKEFRLIRKNRVISVGDAYTFGLKESGIPLVNFGNMYIPSDVRVFHYGWVRQAEKMLLKVKSSDAFAHNEKEWQEMHKNDDKIHTDGKYKYSKQGMIQYNGIHPFIMKDRINTWNKENPITEENDMSLGVRIIGPAFDTSGIAQVCRETCLAFYDIGVSVHLVDIPDFNPVKADIQPERLNKLKQMQANKLDKYVTIHMYPVERINQIDMNAKANIVWINYETDRIPYVWSLILNQPAISDVVVPTEFNKMTFSKGGVNKDKISVAPFGVDTERYTPNGAKLEFLKEDEAFNFGFVSTFKNCKGYDVLFSAFFEEFKNEPKAKLVLKTDLNTGDFEKEKQYIINVIRSFKKDSKAEIIYIAENYSEEKMEALYRSLDCFVLPSRGEGWGLGYLQSMASGVVPIATNCSAQRSYLNSDNALLVDAPQVKINSIEWLLNARFQQEHFWWEPNLDQLRKQMRYAFENKDKLNKMGEQSRKDSLKYDWKESVTKILPILKKYE